jgi:hypothetical protein
MNEHEGQSETPPDTSEHPEMDRASAEVAALVSESFTPPVGDMPPGDVEEKVEASAGQYSLHTQANVDRDILFAALCRLARLHGVNVPGEIAGDIDMAGLSPEYVRVVDWARAARLA